MSISFLNQKLSLLLALSLSFLASATVSASAPDMPTLFGGSGAVYLDISKWSNVVELQEGTVSEAPMLNVGWSSINPQWVSKGAKARYFLKTDGTVVKVDDNDIRVFSYPVSGQALAGSVLWGTSTHASVGDVIISFTDSVDLTGSSMRTVLDSTSNYVINATKTFTSGAIQYTGTLTPAATEYRFDCNNMSGNISLNCMNFYALSWNGNNTPIVATGLDYIVFNASISETGQAYCWGNGSDGLGSYNLCVTLFSANGLVNGSNPTAVYSKSYNVGNTIVPITTSSYSYSLFGSTPVIQVTYPPEVVAALPQSNNDNVGEAFFIESVLDGSPYVRQADIKSAAVQSFAMFNPTAANQIQAAAHRSPLGNTSNFDGGQNSNSDTDDLVFTGTDVEVWYTSANTAPNHRTFGQAPAGNAAALVATCDVSGDGMNDMVFQTAGGDVFTRVFDNFGGQGYVDSWLTTTSSVVKGCGDFNADGTGDLVLQNTSSGDISVMLLQNGQVSSSNWLGAFSSYRVKAVGDINGDGTDDIIMQDPSSYDIAVITMLNGQKVQAIWNERWPGRAIIGTGDVNGDGIADLYTDYNGDLAVITMSNTGSYSGGYWLGTFSNYAARAVADVDGDGLADFVLQDNVGNVATVTINSNATVKNAVWLGGWDFAIKGAIDTDGDGDADVVMQRVSDGAVGIIEMQNGLNVASRWIANTSETMKVFP